jgi:hypothetical protein
LPAEQAPTADTTRGSGSHESGIERSVSAPRKELEREIAGLKVGAQAVLEKL